jgi:hypothetical protein
VLAAAGHVAVGRVSSFRFPLSLWIREERRGEKVELDLCFSVGDLGGEERGDGRDNGSPAAASWPRVRVHADGVSGPRSLPERGPWTCRKIGPTGLDNGP